VPLRESRNLTHNGQMTSALPSTDRVKKHVATLAMVPQSGAITRIGRQAYTVMMVLASEQAAADPSRVEFRAPLSSVLKGFDGSDGSTAELKKHLKSMVTHVIDWQSPSGGEGASWTASALVAQVSLFKVNNENWIEWAYAPKMKAEILSPTLYAQIQLSTVSKFRTHAGLALYEICARYKDNPSHLTAKQKWQWWVSVLSGKPPSKELKTEFRFFNRDTLKPAVEEVNEVSELIVTAKEIKVGRSVELLQFEVHLKPSPICATPSPVDIGQLKRAKDLGIDPEVAEELFFRHGQLKFGKALERLSSRLALADAKPIASRHAYLKSILIGRAIEESANPVGTKASDSIVEPVEVPVNTSPALKQLAELNQTQSQRVALLRTEIGALSTEELAALIDEMKLNVKLTEASLRRINDGKWDSPVVMGDLMRFYWRKTRGCDWS
jgi:Initiator Replication protein